MAQWLRALSLAECDVVSGIEIESAQESYAGGTIGDVFDRMNASPPRQLPFALVDGDTAVGFIVARENAALPTWAKEGCLSLHNLRVDRRFQGHGHGRLLMQLVGRWIAEKRPAVARVMASVNAENLSALNFNLACGFVPTGETFDGRLGRETILIAPVERLGTRQLRSMSTRSL